jgi:hypothetical protein
VRQASCPRLPFSADHIRKFLDLAWASECDLKLWRGVLGHVVCFQQLVRIGEVANVTGANIEMSGGSVSFINVRAKNHKAGYPHPLVFPVDGGRNHCIGWFLVSFIRKIGLEVRNASHFLACKIASKAGVVSGFPAISVSSGTLMKEGKITIKLIGLDALRYASHSAKRGGTLAGAQAGLDSARLTLVGQWKSPEMSVRYINGGAELCNSSIDLFRM